MGLPLSDGIVWMYTGFTKTFGYLGIAAAFIFTARRENRARTAAAMIPLAVTASVASITEPIDFLFCFVSPLLWVAHAVITGGFMVLLHVLHVRAFTSNLLGSLVFNLSAGEQLQNMPLLYLLGLAETLTYFAVFSVLIKAKDLPTRAGKQPFPQTSPRTPTRRRCAGLSPRWVGRRTSPSWETASPASGSRCGMPRCWIWGLCSLCPIKVLWCRAPGSSWSAACTPPSSAMRLNSSLPRWPRCDCILIRETV